MIEKLTVAGGIVKIDGIDIGFCREFKLYPNIKWLFDDVLLSTQSNKHILVSNISTEGVIEEISVTGSFVCESISAKMLFGIFAHSGFNTISGNTKNLFAELDLNQPFLYNLSFESIPEIGTKIEFISPKTYLFINEDIILQSNDEFMDLPIQFSSKFKSSIELPSLTISEFGDY